MSERRSRTTFGNRFFAYLAAGLVHIGIVAALVVKLDSNHETIVADDADKIAPVRASTIDESEIEKAQERLRQQDIEKQKKAQEQRDELERLKREQELEKKRLDELEAEKKKSEKEAAELERKKKEIDLKAKEAAEKAKREAEERDRLKKEQEEKDRRERIAREKERKRQEEIERKKKAEAEAKAKREAEARAARIAEERAASLASKYAALIQQAVRPKITISPDFHSSLEAEINVKLSASGEVRQVRIVRSSGNINYDRAVETAIYASSPLPIPSATEDPAVNKQFQDLVLSFSP